MLEISVDDICQMYKGCIILYKNKPVHVVEVDRNGEVEVFDLFTQRTQYVPFSLKEFQPLNRRLGFINTQGSVLYAYRLPLRKYKVGIHLENLKIVTLGVAYPRGAAQTKERIRELMAPEIADALYNKYPTFKQAVDHVNKRGGIVAFDKQFAIEAGGIIYYKNKSVGDLPKGKKEIEDIVFSKGKEHLIHLIGNNYAKNLRAA